MAVKEGDRVKVEYEGRLDDGTVFDSSSHGDHSHPIEFEVGAHQVIPGFEKGVIGMEIDEEKEIKIMAADAYGEPREELKKKFPREQLPKDHEPEVGMMLALQAPDGRQIPAKIVEVNETEVVIDLNHPLAGKNLTFNVKVVDIL